MTENNENLIQTLATKIKNLITTHNTSNTSHTDIRTTLNGKSNTGHTHTKNQVTDLPASSLSGSYNDLTNKPTLATLSTMTEELKIGDVQDLGGYMLLYLAKSSTTVSMTGGASGKTCEISFDRIGQIVFFRVFATYTTQGWSGTNAPYSKNNVCQIPAEYTPKRNSVFHVNNNGTEDVSGMVEFTNTGSVNVKISDKTKEIMYYVSGSYITDYTPLTGQ